MFSIKTDKILIEESHLTVEMPILACIKIGYQAIIMCAGMFKWLRSKVII